MIWNWALTLMATMAGMIVGLFVGARNERDFQKQIGNAKLEICELYLRATKTDRDFLRSVLDKLLPKGEG